MREETMLWYDSSKYDLECAKAMLSAEKYNYAVFFCHQNIKTPEGNNPVQKGQPGENARPEGITGAIKDGRRKRSENLRIGGLRDLQQATTDAGHLKALDALATHAHPNLGESGKETLRKGIEQM
ncbi:hypothetical protein HZC09_01145 [Candidatus Micrarchaeota archaeon]|nr:hypothetical protein [Candidatus Micrarchaeota archaeon]